MDRWLDLLRRVAFTPSATPAAELTAAPIRLIKVTVTPKLIDTEDPAS